MTITRLWFIQPIKKTVKRKKNYKTICQNSYKKTEGLIQAYWMSGRRLKKLNLLIEFSSSILIKFYLKAYWHWICIQNKLNCIVSSILKYLFALQNVKQKQNFLVLSPKPHQGSTMNPLQSLQHLETPTCILPLKTQSYFKKRTLVKLLG